MSLEWQRCIPVMVWDFTEISLSSTSTTASALSDGCRHVSFIQLFIPNIYIAPFKVHYYSDALPITALPLFPNCHVEALESTVSEGVTYMAAKAGFEPATFRMQGTELTSEPPCPTSVFRCITPATQ